MFGIIKSFFGGIWSYVAIALAAVAGVVAVFMQGRASGKAQMEKDSLEALRESEAEAHKVMTERMHKEKEAVDEANKRTRHRDFD